jgi:hypothetical protein
MPTFTDDERKLFELLFAHAAAVGFEYPDEDCVFVEDHPLIVIGCDRNGEQLFRLAKPALALLRHMYETNGTLPTLDELHARWRSGTPWPAYFDTDEDAERWTGQDNFGRPV